MMQKTITVGNSTAITIPKDFFKEARVDENSVVTITQQPKKKRIIVDFSQEEIVDEVIDREVYTVAQSLLKRYLPAFRELAKK